LLEDYRTENARAAERSLRRRPKKFTLTDKNTRRGGGNVNPDANRAAEIARTHALLTGRFSAPTRDEDSAS